MLIGNFNLISDHPQSGYQSQQPQPTITMGNATSKFDESRSQNADDDDEKKKTPVKKPQGNVKQQKMPEGQQTSGGWFGGIFSKLSMKPKNQMILPDDKNPAVSFASMCEKILLIIFLTDRLGRSDEKVGQQG